MTFRVIDGDAGKSDRVVSLPEVGTIDIERCSDGWRVHHLDYDGDHGSLIDRGLPSRSDAIHAALTYAIAILETPVAVPGWFGGDDDGAAA
jgi:hypothetical protein